MNFNKFTFVPAPRPYGHVLIGGSESYRLRTYAQLRKFLQCEACCCSAGKEAMQPLCVLTTVGYKRYLYPVCSTATIKSSSGFIIANTANIFTVSHDSWCDEDKSEHLTDMDTDSCTDSSTHWTTPSPVGSYASIC